MKNGIDGITENAMIAMPTPSIDLGIVIIGSLEIKLLFWFKIRLVCNCDLYGFIGYGSSCLNVCSFVFSCIISIMSVDFHFKVPPCFC